MLVFTEVGQSELVINKSKFIGFTLKGNSKNDFLSLIATINNNHASASHVAFAYQLKKQHRIDAYFNDAGEPFGTAGKPLLNIIESKQIVNSGIAVVRYYGGVNLGTGKLARAYNKAGMLALSSSKLTDFVELKKYNLLLKYNMLEIIINVINNNRSIVLDKHFDINILVIAMLTKEAVDNIQSQYPAVQVTLAE